MKRGTDDDLEQRASNDDLELRAASGFIDPELSAELPGLRLDWLTVPRPGRGASSALAHRLKELSNRYRGASVVAMRTHPVPHAYRAFFRQIGLDPDANRIPSEEAAVARLLQGQFQSRGVLNDALLIALVETGVPVWALDADLVDPGGLGIRTTVAGDRLGASDTSYALPPAQLVVSDARCVHAILFGEIAPGHAASAHTDHIALFSVGVEGVPAIHIEEALWVCVEALRTA